MIRAVTNSGGTPVGHAVLSDGLTPVGQIEPPYASWVKRVAAALLDGGIGGATTFLAFGDQHVSLPFLGANFLSTDQPSVTVDSLGGTATWTDSGWAVGVVVVMIAMQAYLGATPGKLVLGIALVRERDARPIGVMWTVLRSLAHLLDAIFLIGYLRPLWNNQRKTFADSIMCTVVLDTRRPRRHPWVAPRGGSSTAPGREGSWQGPEAPRWWTVATAISAAAALAGALFTIAPSSEQGSRPFELICQMPTSDEGPLGLTGGTLSSSSGSGTTTRLGVTRRVNGPGGQIKVTWEWTAPLPPTPGVVLRASFARADGTSARHYDFPVTDGAAQSASFSLPADSLTGLGDSWTWSQTVVVDGVQSPACLASAEGLAL
jgi:Mce-associated membrane protein